MAEKKTLRTLSTGSSIGDSDLFISRQGSDTEDVSITALQLLTYVTYTNNVAENSANQNLIYVGTAKSGTATSAASWKIKRLDFTSGLTTTYADGNQNYDNIWDNRESLSYS